jgi:general secretion pathway protein J
MKRSQAGMTLIEVMVAIAVLALMMAIAWGTIIQTGRAKKHFGQVQDRYREARIALTRISRDLSMSYLSLNEDTSHLDRRTYFKADSMGSVDGVRFSTFAHTRLYADANETDQTIVGYYAGDDPDERGMTDLFRRELRRPGYEKFESMKGEADIVFRDIDKLELTYWDPINREWKESWDSTAADQANKLPDRVKIALTFRDENDREITLTTQARVAMQEALNGFAN